MFFNEKIVEELISDCKNYPEYAVGIFIKSKDDMEGVYNKITKHISSAEIKKERSNVDYQINIRLNNDSIIDLLVISGSGCMRRYETIIYDDGLDENLITPSIIAYVPNPQIGAKEYKIDRWL